MWLPYHFIPAFSKPYLTIPVQDRFPDLFESGKPAPQGKRCRTSFPTNGRELVARKGGRRLAGFRRGSLPYKGMGPARSCI
jgi:hypothetical protein